MVTDAEIVKIPMQEFNVHGKRFPCYTGTHTIKAYFDRCIGVRVIMRRLRNSVV